MWTCFITCIIIYVLLKKAQIVLFSGSGISLPSLRICNTVIMGIPQKLYLDICEKAPMGNTSYKIFDLEMLLFS